MSEANSMTVVCCPRCGSTDAGEGDSSLAPPGDTQMVCSSCGHCAVVDHWELKFEWNCTVPATASLVPFVFVRKRFIDALHALCFERSAYDDFVALQPVRALASRVASAWSEPHRHYHSLQHLSECLRWLDDRRVRAAIERHAEVEIALFLHDLVYDTARADNEAQSADESRALLAAVPAVPPAVIDRVCAMILATKDHSADTSDAAVMLDIDLSILGAAPERFREYQRQVRQEWAWVDPDAYAVGRAAVLRKFAARERLYRSDALHHLLEADAKRNLEAALGGA